MEVTVGGEERGGRELSGRIYAGTADMIAQLGIDIKR